MAFFFKFWRKTAIRVDPSLRTEKLQREKRPIGYFMNRGDRLVRHALQQANDSGDEGEHQPAQTEQPAGIRLLLFSVLLMAFHDKGTSERAF
jgi:hypothetical protein